MVNLILIKPGLANSIKSILVSFFLINSIITFDNSSGDLEFNLASTIDTFVEISKSIDLGVLSTLIPFKLSGSTI